MVKVEDPKNFSKAFSGHPRRRPNSHDPVRPRRPRVGSGPRGLAGATCSTCGRVHQVPNNLLRGRPNACAKRNSANMAGGSRTAFWDQGGGLARHSSGGRQIDKRSWHGFDRCDRSPRQRWRSQERRLLQAVQA
jgi:hypothetical protein